MAKISIIIPCYNVEQYIHQCIQSASDQSYLDLEIICVNDGSTDGTLTIIKKLAEKDSRIIVVDQSNGGLSNARNVGIERSSSEFIMFVDGDDWLEENCVEKTFDQNHDLICFSYNRVFKNKVERRFLNLEGEYTAHEVLRRVVGLIGEELKDPGQANALVTAWGKIYRSDLIKKNRLKFIDTHEIGTEDALFNLEYLKNCDGLVKIIDRPYYNYLRYNINSLSITYKKNLVSQWQVLHSRMFQLIKATDGEVQEAFYNRIALSIIGLGLNEMENPAGWKTKTRNLKKVLQDDLYINSYAKLKYQYFPLHWKILFYFAKYRVTLGVYLMMKAMSWLWKRKNN